MTVKENYFNSSRMTARHDHQYQHSAKKKILTRPRFHMFKSDNLCYINHGHSSTQDLPHCRHHRGETDAATMVTSTDVLLSSPVRNPFKPCRRAFGRPACGPGRSTFRRPARCLAFGRAARRPRRRAFHRPARRPRRPAFGRPARRPSRRAFGRPLAALPCVRWGSGTLEQIESNW